VVNYSRFIGRAARLMYRPSVIESTSDRMPENAPRWISRVQKVAAVKKWFRGSLEVFGVYEIISEEDLA